MRFEIDKDSFLYKLGKISADVFSGVFLLTAIGAALTPGGFNGLFPIILSGIFLSVGLAMHSYANDF